MACSPAQAVTSTSHRVQGGYYIIQFKANVSYPVDCQINWQVGTASGFTRQGYATANNAPGNSWSEVMGPMTQDVTSITHSANCQLSYQERQRREREEAQRRLEEGRRQAVLRQRQAQERARAEAALRARQEASRKKAEEDFRRAHTIKVPDYSDVVQKNEADRRAYFQRQAEEAARGKAQARQQAEAQRQQQARQAEEKRRDDARRQTERIQRAQDIMQQTDSLSQQMRQQAQAQDAITDQIAADGADRTQGMTREANSAAQTRSGADIHHFLQQQLGTTR